MSRPLIPVPSMAGLAGAAALLLSLPAGAEILFLDSGRVVTAEPEYIYQHPSLSSLVFVSSQARQMAILPPAPVVVLSPPLLWRAPYSPMPLYPPASVPQGFNASARPSNQDMASYHLQRSHAFSQDLYNRNTYLNLGGNPSAYLYGYGAYGYPYPPPVVSGGFNQSARPSNQDMVIYHLNRSHSFSMDLYKKP